MTVYFTLEQQMTIERALRRASERRYVAFMEEMTKMQTDFIERRMISLDVLPNPGRRESDNAASRIHVEEFFAGDLCATFEVQS